MTENSQRSKSQKLLLSAGALVLAAGLWSVLRPGSSGGEIGASEGPVSYYAKVRTLSTSGSATFYYYDPEKGEAECEQEDGWFWGVIRQPEDSRKALEFFQFLGAREGHVFKVTGVKEKDDCDYREGKCLTSLSLDKVEAVGAL